MKKTRYIIEALLLRILFVFFKCLPPQTASNVGGFIGRTIGPRMAASRKAYRHLQTALPEKDKNAQRVIIKGMWDNLGRVIAEYPHLKKLSTDYTEIHDLTGEQSALHSDGAAVFIGAHLANWEINCIASYTQLDLPITLTYREPNNPMVAKLLEKSRTLNGQLTALPKSRKSGKKLLQTLKNAKTLGILIDQKYNEGIEVPFFGHSAMTNPVFVQLCQRYKCPLIPVRCERIKGCHFKLTAYPAIPTLDEQGKPLPTQDVINAAHKHIEKWIRQRPEQWLWVHRRWKKTPKGIESD